MVAVSGHPRAGKQASKRRQVFLIYDRLVLPNYGIRRRTPGDWRERGKEGRRLQEKEKRERKSV